jgi:hypothetical protein
VNQKVDLFLCDALRPEDMLFSCEYRLEGFVSFGVGTCVNFVEEYLS